MSASTDSNAEIWQSEEGVRQYVSKQDAREQKRRAQWRLMGEILPFRNDERFNFMDIGAGTGVAARAILDLYPQATAILADFSNQMMEEATRVMEPYEGRYSYVSFDMTSGNWPESVPSDLGAVVTSQCVHHINDERKRALFAEIYDHLQPGGWYVNFDPINTEDPLIDAAWQRANERLDPLEAEKGHHRSPEEQRRYENHVRYMVPLEPQLELFKQAGFKAVDVYWKQLDYVIYGGLKPRAGQA